MTPSKYIIKSFESSLGQIVVEFYNGEELCIDIPIYNGHYITGDELNTFILGFLPRSEERINEVKNAINSEDIHNLVLKEDDSVKETHQKYINTTRNFNYRNNQLRLTDWIFLEDSPVSSSCKDEWKVYRKTLRELLNKDTMICEFNLIAWPTPPKMPLIYGVNYTPEQ